MVLDFKLRNTKTNLMEVTLMSRVAVQVEVRVMGVKLQDLMDAYEKQGGVRKMAYIRFLVGLFFLLL